MYSYRYDFEDGGWYVGEWEGGQAHGFGVSTGPRLVGEFAGFWQRGFEASGVYRWPSGNTYEGQWAAGRRQGLGRGIQYITTSRVSGRHHRLSHTCPRLPVAETKGKWVYRGQWFGGQKGPHGVRENTNTGAHYEGCWTLGIQDGHGVELYADTSTPTEPQALVLLLGQLLPSEQ